MSKAGLLKDVLQSTNSFEGHCDVGESIHVSDCSEVYLEIRIELRRHNCQDISGSKLFILFLKASHMYLHSK